MRIIIMLSVITVLLYYQSSGSTINVPDDINTIQGAINIAGHGDTVLVDEGTYFENINFKGKAIIVASKFIMDEDTSHISKTIINGSQPSHPDSGSVVFFDNGEDTTSVLCGFTITRGAGTRNMYLDPDWGPVWMRSGGGIFVDSSGAKIVHNIVRDNKVQTTLHATGGGIRAWAVPAGKTVLIANNHILNNVVDVPENSGGGGIDIYNLLVDNGHYIIGSNIVEYNEVHISKTWKAWGGGMACHVDLPFNGRMDISGNIIRHNELYCYNTFGAGIYVTYWQHDNTSDYNNNPYIYNNLINNNISPKHGAAISIWNLFRHDYSTAILSPKPFICNNTIVDNNGNSAIHIFQSIPLFVNNILRNFNDSSCDFRFEYGFGVNKKFNGIELYNNFIADTTSLFANCSQPISENNIFKVDTLFTDLSYSLAEGSQCIGSGTDSIEVDGVWYKCPATDYFGNQRPNPRDNLVDMGAIESDHPSGIADYVNDFPQNYHLDQNYPNPFNPSTTIKFRIPNSEFTTLKVYNILGKEVATLVSKKMNPGNYTYTFDGKNLASGVYYYKLVAGDFGEVKKMILLK